MKKVVPVLIFTLVIAFITSNPVKAEFPIGVECGVTGFFDESECAPDHPVGVTNHYYYSLMNRNTTGFSYDWGYKMNGFYIHYVGEDDHIFPVDQDHGDWLSQYCGDVQLFLLPNGWHQERVGEDVWDSFDNILAWKSEISPKTDDVLDRRLLNHRDFFYADTTGGGGRQGEDLRRAGT